MITAAVIDICAMIVGELLNALPETKAPEWLSNAGGYIPEVMQFASSMGVWFPWGVLGVVLASVYGVWILSFSVKIARICISHFTGGGGSAA